MKIEMKPYSLILSNHGLDKNGDVQRFHTNNVMRRMAKYMPYLTGASIKLMINQTSLDTGQIVLKEPQARYLYYGKVMIGKAPKTVTEKDLNYTKTKNNLAGPFWDRRMWAAEGDSIQRELQRYANRSRQK